MNKDFSYKAAFLLLSWPPKDSYPLSQESPAITSLFHFTTVVLKTEQQHKSRKFFDSADSQTPTHQLFTLQPTHYTH